MAERDHTPGQDQARDYDDDAPCRHGRTHHGVDPLALLAGIGTLLVSVYVLSDGASWLPAIDPRWVLAGGATLAGLIMLAASVRHNRR